MIKISFLFFMFSVLCCTSPTQRNEAQSSAKEKEIKRLQNMLMGKDTAFNRENERIVREQTNSFERFRSPQIRAREKKFIDSFERQCKCTDVQLYSTPLIQGEHGKLYTEYLVTLSTPFSVYDKADSLRKVGRALLPVVYNDVLVRDSVLIDGHDTAYISSMVVMFRNAYDWNDRLGSRYGMKDPIFKKATRKK